jgi:hypothetical protein
VVAHEEITIFSEQRRETLVHKQLLFNAEVSSSLLVRKINAYQLVLAERERGKQNCANSDCDIVLIASKLLNFLSTTISSHIRICLE